MSGLTGRSFAKQIAESDPQLQGTWAVEDLRLLCGEYHGEKGDFTYRAYQWLNQVVFDGKLPVTLFQWALTAWGGCLGQTHSPAEHPPVITLHPAIWQPHGFGKPGGWSRNIPYGRRYTLDVVLHELIHVEVDYLMGGHHGKSSHDCPEWCEAIMKAAQKLKGTMIEVPPFKAAPTKRVRENGKRRRRTPAGSITMDEISKWPHSIRVPDHYGAQEVPF